MEPMEPNNPLGEFSEAKTVSWLENVDATPQWSSEFSWAALTV